MWGTFTHSLSVRVANRLNVYQNRSGLEFKKMVLGIEILLIDIPKTILVFCLAAILGVVGHTAVVFGTFVLIRRYAAGLHAKTGLVCTIMSVVMFVAAPLLLRNIEVGNLVVATVFAISNVIFFCFAPADTQARPILGLKNRTKLKMKCLVANNLLLVFALTSGNRNISFLVLLGILYGVIAILPITYKILKRRRKNYENYE